NEVFWISLAPLPSRSLTLEGFGTSSARTGSNSLCGSDRCAGDARLRHRRRRRHGPGGPRPPLAPAARIPGPAAGALLHARGLARARGVRRLSSRAARRLEDEPPFAIHGARGRRPARRDARERSRVSAELLHVPRAPRRAGAA